jgi:hypothetical protein
METGPRITLTDTRPPPSLNQQVHPSGSWFQAQSPGSWYQAQPPTDPEIMLDCLRTSAASLPSENAGQIAPNLWMD